MIIRKFFFYLLFCSSLFLFAQTTKKEVLIQFSGVVVEQDSLKAIPFASVMVKNKNRGTISDFFGFFSFVAITSDTIEFSAIGYKKIEYIIPDTLSGKTYSLIEVLPRDTVFLREIEIHPWPTREHFKAAFLQLNIAQDDMERAQINLAREALREQMNPMPMDGSMNYKNYMDQQYSKLYYAGQYPTISLLNPVAWSKFIEAWRKGELKIK